MTTYARLHSDLSDVQTLSAFHALRADGRGHEPPSAAQWSEFIADAQGNVASDASLTEARRRSLMNRLTRAADENVDGATWYAVRNIAARAQRQTQNVTDRLTGYAEDMGVDVATVTRQYREAQDTIDRSRSAAAPEGYTDESVADARAAGLPEDRGSIVAMRHVEALARRARADRALNGPQRIERTALRSGTVAEAGYDPDGGRLEVVFRRRDGGTSRVYAYTGVPEEAANAVLSGASAGAAYNQHVRNRAEYRYPTQEDADLDSAARQCPDCGQFASSSHACPTRIAREQEASRAVRAGTAADREPAGGRRRATDAERNAEAAANRPPERRLPNQYRSRRTRYVGDIPGLPEMSGRARYDHMTLPGSLSSMRTAAGTAPVVFAVQMGGARTIQCDDVVSGEMPAGSFRVTAEVAYDRPRRGQHVVDVRSPRCSCAVYARDGDCPHVRLATTHLQAALPPATAQSASPAALDPAVAQRQVEEALRQDWTRAQDTAEEARARWAQVSDPQDSYSDNYAAFEQDYQAALDRKAAGEPPVPYLSENALGGLCAEGSGRRFGVELEFDLPAQGRQAALANIGAEMYQAGLTPSPHQAYYHSDRTTYTQHERGWKFETDCTVSGEIISPAMEDTPETWENVARVCDIIRRHGGKASVRTGSHVHVSSPSTTPETATALSRMVTQHEDVMYRVSQDPQRGQHRRLEWCGPNRDIPPAGYTDIHTARSAQYGHNLGLNMQSVTGGVNDHAEIRHWDGTLDPAVIQTQVKISAAMVAAAERTGTVEGGGLRGRERVGTHARRVQGLLRGSRRALTSEELREDSATARSFADTLFSRREDKAQFAALFAITKWHRR